MTKICNQCHQKKLVEYFYLDKIKKSPIFKSKCKDCIKLNKKEKYKKNKQFREKIKKASLKWAHSEQGKLLRRIANKKRLKTKKFKQYHKWWEKNTNKGKASYKRRLSKWLKTDNGRQYSLRKTHKRRIRMKDLIFDLTAKEWKEIIKKQNNKCNMCKKEFGEKLRPTQDHIVPISKKGNYTKNNIQALCRRCNGIKQDKIWIL